MGYGGGSSLQSCITSRPDFRGMRMSSSMTLARASLSMYSLASTPEGFGGPHAATCEQGALRAMEALRRRT